MGVRRQNRYSVDFKLQLITDYLAGEGSLKGIANRHGVNHSTLLYWLKKHQRGELTDDDHLNDQVREYEAQIAALERKVGQLTMELDALKKGLRVIPVTPNGPLSLISGPAVSRSSEDAGS
jgi:transposase-like protein